MARPRNRAQLMDKLNAIQTNPVWSWCGVDHQSRKVYFSIWTDKQVPCSAPTAYLMQEPNWGLREDGSKKPARVDQDEKIELVFNSDYAALGYFIVAKDPHAQPREISETRTSFVVTLKVSRLQDGSVIGVPESRIEIR